MVELDHEAGELANSKRNKSSSSNETIPSDFIITPLENNNDHRPEHFALTELGNAERIYYYHKDKIKYSNEKGWLLWDGTRWIEDEARRIETLASRTIRGIYKEAANADDPDVRAYLTKWARKSEKRSIMLNSIEGVKPYVYVSNDSLDSDPYLLNVKNGVIDLNTGELMEHKPEYLITKLSPIEYDKEATSPRWKKFLNEVFIKDDGSQDDEVIHFIQKAIGYSLSADTSEQAMFFLTGNGSNGKSLFVEVIQSILGDYSKQTNSDTFIQKKNGSSINNDIARLDKTRFVSAIESEEGQKLAESLVKQLTGEDKISARFLRQEFFEFRPEFKVFFATNHKPVITGNDEGIWRRIRLIPFNAKFTETLGNIDKNLSKKLNDELPGILNWAIEGFKMWKNEGLGVPSSIDESTKEYREEMDVLHPYIQEYCTISPIAREKAQTIYQHYTRYSEDAGEIKYSSRRFYRLLELKGFKKYNGAKNQVYFSGIAINPDLKIREFNFSNITEKQRAIDL